MLEAPANSKPQQIRIGDREIDLDNGTVAVAGERRAITHQATRVLKALVEAAPETCTRETLIDSVWDGNYLVANRAIPSVIYTLRKALGDHGSSRLIRTVPRVGYRLTADTAVAVGAPSRRAATWPLATLATAAALAWLVLYVAFAPEVRIRVHKVAMAAEQPTEPLTQSPERALRSTLPSG